MMVRGNRVALVVILATVALGLSAACGSSSSKKTNTTGGRSGAGAAGDDAQAGDSAQGGDAASGGSSANGGSSMAGSAGDVDSEAGAGGVAGGEAGAGGASGEAGASGSQCLSPSPSQLQGVWTTNCNGYTCKMNIAEAGVLATGCTNGQYSTGTLSEAGAIATSGEGGAFQPFSTEGTLIPTSCDSMKLDYIGQTPPVTGPKLSYSCALTRVPACAPTLLEALAGTWVTTCGNSTCTTVFTAAGGMTSTCSNGQQSSGSIDARGYFSDTGSGGNFPAYSTQGVIALTSCNTFSMPYTYQTPPNQGNKTSQQCAYTRKVP